LLLADKEQINDGMLSTNKDLRRLALTGTHTLFEEIILRITLLLEYTLIQNEGRFPL
jgi:hypothetical protein